MAKRCNACRGPLGRQYIKADGVLFHRACFRCNFCGQPVQGEYALRKQRVYHPKCVSQAGKRRRCAHCQQSVTENWITFAAQLYHESCYRSAVQPHCQQCGLKIEKAYHQDDAGYYHVNCYEQHKMPSCDNCGQALKGEYLQDIWGNRCHKEHAGQRTAQCHVCARLIGPRTSHGGLHYADGRQVCGICRLSEVTEVAQIEHAKDEVLAHLSAVGFDYIPRYISVSFADKRRLNQRLGVSQRANSHGLTRTVERQQGSLRYVEHSIYVLYGLPRVLFHGVLAHEMIHVWLNEKGLHSWPEADIEGFCNLGTALIYQQDGSPLADVLLQRMQQDPHPVYGDGFRKMNKHLQQLGWSGLLSAMQNPSAPRQTLQKLNRWLDKWL